MTNDKNKIVDLSSMDIFEIEPSWVKKGESKNTYKNSSGKDRFPDRDRNDERKLRRQNRNKLNLGGEPKKREEHQRFEFKILPQREILERIKKEMKKTGISYALSDICNTISEKNERISIKVRFEGDKPNYFTKTIIDQKVFSSTEKAIDNLLANKSQNNTYGLIVLTTLMINL